MKPANQQTLDARHLDKNSSISWKKPHHNHVTFDWNSHKHDQEEYRIPIIEPSPKLDRPYCFDQKQSSSKSQIIIQEKPVKAYFQASLCACVTFFWMFAGIVCFIQSLKIRRLLKKNNPESIDQAKDLSNRLYTNLVLTYVMGGIIIGVLIMTVLVTFIVGFKGYFSKSL